MPDEVQGWELFALLSLRGEAEFRAKLADINRLIDDTQRKMSGLGGGGGGTASAGIRGNFAPLAGGGPTAGIPGNFSNAGGAARSADIFMGGGGGLRPNALLDDFMAGVTTPGADIFMGGGGGGGATANTTGFPRGRRSSGTAGAGNIGKGKPDTFVGDPTFTMGAGLVGKGASDGMKELEKATKAAATSTKQFGLHQAWILRAATSGGIPGIMGGGAGALASLIPGLGMGLTGGALLGNFAGQMAGGLFERVRHNNAPDVEMGNPGLAILRQQAARDAQAAAGRNYRDTYKEGTKMERLWGDFHAKGGQTVGGAVGNIWDNITQAFEFGYYKVLKMVQGIPSAPGASAGLAPSPGGGQTFSSIGEAHNAIIKASLRHGFGGGGSTGGPGFWESVLNGVSLNPIQAIIPSQLSSTAVQ